jgi:HEAT repeat protein
MGEPAVPALIDRLRSSDLAPRTRRNVAGALSSVGRPAFEPALALFETAADPEVRAAALQVAAATGGQEAAEALLQATGDASAGVRVAAASGLGALRETRAGSVLADLVARADEDPAVRQAAATALRALGSAPAAPLLAAAGDRRAPLDVRLYAAGLAAGLDAVVAAPALLAIAADTENPALLRRVSAGLARPAPGSGAEAMARAGSGGVRDAFTAAEVEMVFRVAIDDPLIRELVPQLLAEGGGIVRPAVLALVAHPLAQVRRLAARTLGGEARDWKVSAAAREAVPLWLEALADADEDRRLAAAKALGGTADARALEPLLSLLAGDPATLVRGEAATAVGAIGVASADPRALAQLLAALADPEDHVRYMAAESLGRLRNAASVEPLIALLGGHRGLQVSAARALAEIGDPRALEPLRTARSKVAFPGDIEAIDAAIQKLEAAQP